MAALVDSHYPTAYLEFVQSIIYRAELTDIGMVDCLLQLAFQRRGIEPVDADLLSRFPRHFIQELAAILRLFRWEASGIRIHIDAGLPSANVALRRVMTWLSDVEAAPERDRERLQPQIYALLIKHIAWSKLLGAGTDLALGEIDDEVLVDALANFCWSMRDQGKGGQKREDLTMICDGV